MPSPFEIRAATLDDVAALVPLLGELGYALSEAAVRENIARLSNSPTDRVWVAESAAGILGVVSVHLTPLLHASRDVGRVTSLVVASRSRGQGIGQKLLATAEAFCWDAHCERIEVTSADHRVDAHRFYQRLGYEVRSQRFTRHR